MIDSPFDVRKYNYTIKPEKRSVPAVGPMIAVELDASSPLAVLVKGSGLSNVDSDRLLEQSTNEAEMWLRPADEVKDGIVFDLPGSQMLESIAVWNYNKPAYTDLGVQKVDISVWTQQNGWKTILKDVELQEAEGSNDYDEPTILTFDPVGAEKVRFENMTAFNPKMKQAGLSEICFYGPLGPGACNPEPSEGARISYSDAVVLIWTPGRGAIVHDVYGGLDKDALASLGRVKGDPQVKVVGLQASQEYFWRIDEVAKDGTVETGPVWSFNVHGQQVAHWKLDENVEDAVGSFAGIVEGQPQWQAGHDGQAIQLDGQNDYVEIPALNLNTDSMTICAWINAGSQQSQIPGIVFSRSDKTVAGINLLGNRLRYHWNAMPETYNWNSGLTVPQDRWVFVALTVQPEKGTLYLYDEGELKSADNLIIHGVEEFDSPLCIGRDSYDNRNFVGAVDDVQIFDFALSRSQIEQVRQGQPVDMNAESQIQLVDADLVQEGQSLEDIAAEQAESENGGKSKNLIAVLVIVLIIVGFAVVSVLRKKK